MPKEHDFTERKQFSDGVDLTECGVLEKLVTDISGATGYERASKEEDKKGTDWWILRKHGLPKLSVDMKNREYCPIERWGTDDANIETTSVYTGPVPKDWRTTKSAWVDRYRQVPGWTLDETKRTDYVIYTWPHREGKIRYWIVPFPFLCITAQRWWKSWTRTYKEKPAFQDHARYVTLNVFVPRAVITAAMKPCFSNVLGLEKLSDGTWKDHVTLIQQELWPNKTLGPHGPKVSRSTGHT